MVATCRSSLFWYGPADGSVLGKGAGVVGQSPIVSFTQPAGNVDPDPAHTAQDTQSGNSQIAEVADLYGTVINDGTKLVIVLSLFGGGVKPGFL